MKGGVAEGGAADEISYRKEYRPCDKNANDV